MDSPIELEDLGELLTASLFPRLLNFAGMKSVAPGPISLRGVKRPRVLALWSGYKATRMLLCGGYRK